MSSEEVSTIAVNPFVRKFVFAIIQSIRTENLFQEDRHVIHADLVPKVSEKVMQASLGESTTSRIRTIVPEKIKPPVNVLKRKDISDKITPVAKPMTVCAPIPSPVRQMPPRVNILRVTPPVQPIVPPITPQKISPIQPIAPPNTPQEIYTGLSQDYGKIVPLLNDPSVSTIECQGTGKPIMIIRAGQRQTTRIVLNAEDIKNILKKVSDAAHIPLLEGVFRAAVDNFSINAVISEIIGSRFVIKKQTAYAMLER